MSKLQLHGKYILAKADGSEMDDKAKYFVLRYDKASKDRKAAQAALIRYAAMVEEDGNDALADEIKDAITRERL